MTKKGKAQTVYDFSVWACTSEECGSVCQIRTTARQPTFVIGGHCICGQLYVRGKVKWIRLADIEHEIQKQQMEAV